MVRGWFTPIILLTLVMLLAGCKDRQKFDKARETEKILALHQLQRKYHFEKMAEEFASQLSASHISVNRGEIKRPSREENIKRYKKYFEVVAFEKWDDIEPPVIRFSDDGTMAYTIVSKNIVIRYLDERADSIRESTVFSWVAIYKKYPEGWKIDCVASTNKASVRNIMK